MPQILLCRQWRAPLHPLSVVIKTSLAEMAKMRELVHYFSGLGVDDKGTCRAGESGRVQSGRQTHCGLKLHCRNRPRTVVREAMEVRCWEGKSESQRRVTNWAS